MSSIVRVATIGLLGLVLTPRVPLAAQTNLTATATAPTTVALTWTAGANATGYWVQRAVGTGQFVSITPAKLSGTTYTDAAAPAGSALRYRIRGTYSGSAATYSNKVSVTTPAASGSTASAPPAAPPTSSPATPPPGQPTVAPVALAPVAIAPVTLQPIQQPALVANPTAVPLQRSSGRKLEVAPAPAPAAPANVTPVNPSGFIAKQTGDGQVQLSWRPIDGVSYYVLLGPGVPDGGTRVTGATTFTATGVPPGSHEWAVASYYEPGPVSTPAAEFPRARLTTEPMLLSGWADLHTHPMINLAFAGKLVHGGVDVGSLLPQDLTCRGPTRATSMEHALGEDRPSHGGWNLLSFPCGDELRKTVIQGFQQGNLALVTNNPGRGAPDFLDWPKWNDITHQKMWFEWIRRARDGGLRVMVALATNNRTLADAVAGNGDGPSDDEASGDLQVAEMKSFVARHPDFMEIALGPADVKRIAQANKIAVVLGVELDNLVNWNRFPPGFSQSGAALGVADNRIQQLHQQGVRYVIPIHVVDNAFGGTAVYKSDFNTANLREAGHFWELECSDIGDDIGFTYSEVVDPLRAAGAFVKLGLDPFRRSGPGPTCPGGQSNKSKGHRNVRGLTGLGLFTIKRMMQRGMIVDIDHMSHHAAEKTLELAEQFQYPIVSGHNGIRGLAGADTENNRSTRQLQRISKLHGMFGLGTDDAHRSPWAGLYQRAMNIMGYPDADPSRALYRNGAVGFGTDLNGLVKGPKPGGGNRVQYGPNFPKSSSGSKSWDYNIDGVAHYGMMADFVKDVRTAPASDGTSSQGVPLGVSGEDLVDNHLNRSANYFWQMWVLIDARKSSVQ